MASGNFKGLPRRTARDRILRDNAFNIAKNSKYDGHQRRIASMVDNWYKVYCYACTVTLATWNQFEGGAAWSDTLAAQDKYKSSVLVTHYLPEKLSNSIIRKFEKRKIKSSFKGDIWGTDLAGMYLISKYN